jgi:hypothetical protein
MSDLRKNLILEGIFSVETPDTAGEILCVDGADISDLQTGKALLNTEHINPEDAEKSKTPENFKGFQSIVGRVVNAKKIFSDKDCATDSEKRAWNEYKKPLIYGTVEIWDGPDAHPNARAAASIARMLHKDSEGHRLGLSVEGSTLKREGNILKQTVIRKMALTAKPANRSATIDIVKDTSAPEVAKSMSTKTAQGDFEPLRKSVAMQNIHYVPEILQVSGSSDIKVKLADALQVLRKTLTAGGVNAAPGSLTGGSALQSESQLGKLAKLIGKKPVSREEIKKAVPGISDEQAEKVEKALKAFRLKKSMDFAQNLYEEMTKKKS